MLGRFSHIGVLVEDLPATVKRYQSILGARLVETGHLQETGTDVAVLDLGGIHLELLSSQREDSKVGRLLRERGQGIHHLSFEVENIRQRLEELRRAGVGLLDSIPRPGLHGRQIAFLAPQDTSGILIELAEEIQHPKEND